MDEAAGPRGIRRGGDAFALVAPRRLTRAVLLRRLTGLLLRRLTGMCCCADSPGRRVRDAAYAGNMVVSA